MNPSWRLWDWRMIWRSQMSRQRSHSSRLKRFKGLQERAQKMPRTFFMQEEAPTRVLILRKTYHGNTSVMIQLNSQCSASVLSQEIYKGFRGWGPLKVHLDTSEYLYEENGKHDYIFLQDHLKGTRKFQVKKCGNQYSLSDWILQTLPYDPSPSTPRTTLDLQTLLDRNY